MWTTESKNPTTWTPGTKATGSWSATAKNTTSYAASGKSTASWKSVTPEVGVPYLYVDASIPYNSSVFTYNYEEQINDNQLNELNLTTWSPV